MSAFSNKKQSNDLLIRQEEFAVCPGISDLSQECAVAVAVSGGPDSMALCRLLADYAAEHGGPEIYAVTVDHGLRPAARDEALQVGVWLKDWPFVKHDVLTIPPVENMSSRIMEAARDGRYALMAAYCREQGIDRLFLAHHRDDQAETFLFRLAKGSGLDGLSAMRPLQDYADDLQLVRPLLGFSKDRLVATCEEAAVSFVTDPTNENARFARARLRQAQSVLEKEGLTAKRLAVTASRMARAREALDFYADNIFKNVAAEQGDKLVLDFARLQAEPAEIRLRVLLKAMDIKGYGPRMEKMEGLAARLFEDQSFTKATLGGFIFHYDRKRGLICIEKEKSGKSACLLGQKA